MKIRAVFKEGRIVNGTTWGECVIGVEFVCTSIAEVDSDIDDGVVLSFGLVIVEKDSSRSCNVSLGEKEEVFFGILV